MTTALLHRTELLELPVLVPAGHTGYGDLSSHEPHVVTDNLDELLATLPADLRRAIRPEDRPNLVEIVLDLGRRPEARYTDRFEYLRESWVTRSELDAIETRLGEFGDDNRAGLPATLHRISAMRNRRGAVVGLTMRVGRSVSGIVDILRDIIESGQSVLLMGRPGLGKTTLLREMARVLADEVGKRVVVVDTSNEIAGDGDVPHPAIGRARRMQVAKVAQQHDVMIEAVENHMPEVIVIDEIGRVEETLAARTIAERGVQLIATVHGNTLDNLVANPSMSDLIGGIHAVTLSDEEARRRRTQKTVLERKAPPTFDVVVEMIERDKIAVRRPVADVVDALLRGQAAPPEIRWRDENGDVNIMQPAALPPAEGEGHDFSARTGGRGRRQGAAEDPAPRNGRAGGRLGTPRAGFEKNGGAQAGVYFASQARRAPLVDDEREANSFNSRWSEAEELELQDEELDTSLGSFQAQPVDMAQVRRIYPFGISRSRLARAAKHLGLNITAARTWNEADAVLMLSGEEGLPANSSMLREARELKLPIIGVDGNTYGHIAARLSDLYNSPAAATPLSPRESALLEAKRAAERVLQDAECVELRPQSKAMRNLQHQVAERYHLKSFSVGRDPNRRVKFLPAPGQ